MKTKHTEGPWKVSPDYGKENVYYLWDARNDNYHENISSKAMDANAHLMSAAPELLKSCKKALLECCDLIATDAGNALQAAIAKAEGGTK